MQSPSLVFKFLLDDIMSPEILARLDALRTAANSADSTEQLIVSLRSIFQERLTR